MDLSLPFKVLRGRRKCPGDEDGLKDAQPEDPETRREVHIVERRQYGCNEDKLRDHIDCGETWGGLMLSGNCHDSLPMVR